MRSWTLLDGINEQSIPESSLPTASVFPITAIPPPTRYTLPAYTTFEPLPRTEVRRTFDYSPTPTYDTLSLDSRVISTIPLEHPTLRLKQSPQWESSESSEESESAVWNEYHSFGFASEPAEEEGEYASQSSSDDEEKEKTQKEKPEKFLQEAVEENSEVSPKISFNFERSNNESKSLFPPTWNVEVKRVIPKLAILSGFLVSDELHYPFYSNKQPAVWIDRDTALRMALAARAGLPVHHEFQWSWSASDSKYSRAVLYSIETNEVVLRVSCPASVWTTDELQVPLKFYGYNNVTLSSGHTGTTIFIENSSSSILWPSEPRSFSEVSTAFNGVMAFVPESSIY